MKIIFIVLLLCLTIFAITREYKDQPNCYIENIPEKRDTKTVLYKKLYGCLTADMKTVKWRRSLIGAVIFLILFTILVKQGNLPSYQEMFLIVLIYYITYYVIWLNYTNTITDKVSDIGKNIILKLCKK